MPKKTPKPMLDSEQIALLEEIARDGSDRHQQIQALKLLRRSRGVAPLTSDEADPFAALDVPDELAPRRRKRS